MSVEAAVKAAKALISDMRFRIIGEVSEVSNKPGYKAVYFTIKDEAASLSCMMWKSRFEAADVFLEVGQRIVVDGKFDIYAPQGRMNFAVSALSLEGEGELRARVAKLAAQLEKEGLTSAARKRPLVQYPEIVGLVTSPNGAAVHDVLRTMRRRCPSVLVLFAGVRVEGKGAPASMIKGMETLVGAGAEEILLVRGGGSFENLMPFNDESLARAIAACPVPVITGIGHERDTSIADMVGDLRCATPTAAAESIMPHRDDLIAGIDAQLFSLHQNMSARLRRCWDYSQARATRPALQDFMSMFATDLQMVDILHASLERGLSSLLEGDRLKLEEYQSRLNRALPNAQRQNAQEIALLAERLSRSLPSELPNLGDQLARAGASLNKAMGLTLASSASELCLGESKVEKLGQDMLAPFEQEAALCAARVNDLSPLRTLARGWSIAKNKEGKLISSVTAVSPGDEINLQVQDGVIHATVNTYNPSDFSEIIDWKE